MLHQIIKDTNIQEYKFDASQYLKQVLDNKADIGKLKVWSGDDVTCTKEILVKSPKDTASCAVTGIVKISSSDIVVVDSELVNACLKQIDVIKNTLVKRRSLSSPPWDVTTIPGSRVAVTLPLVEEIQFYSTSGTLTPRGRINVDGMCLGIAYVEDTLVVSFGEQSKVQIMDIGGQVFKTLFADVTGNTLFGSPCYISVSPDHSVIYVSDRDRNNVTCMGTDGTVNWTYQAEDLKSPKGMTTGGDRRLYICSKNNHSVHVVSPAGDRMETIPLAPVSLLFPQAMCYDREEETLYVSSTNVNHPPHANSVKRLSCREADT